MRQVVPRLGGYKPSIVWCTHSKIRSCAASATSQSHGSEVVPVSASGWGLGRDEPVAVYVHLPFCKRKCYYCDFPVVAVGRDTSRTVVQDKFSSYVHTLCTEMMAHTRLNTDPLKTVFFGGGTPSLIPPSQLARVIETLRSQFGLSDDVEMSMEADPGTFDPEKLRSYMALGVTRFSMGVQTFDEQLLSDCGRAHSLDDVHEAIAAMHEAKPASWSLDLISGLPGLTPAKWLHSLQEAIKADPTHISIYDLQVEEGTPFERWQRAGTLSLPPEDTAVTMFNLASRELTRSGYEHYEVSNYAKPGHRCLHNQVYWHGHGYYAFGVGAASFLSGKRFSRPRGYAEWEKFVESCVVCSEKEGGFIGGASMAASTFEDVMLESVMLQLRLADGICLGEFSDRFGRENADKLVKGLMPYLKDGRALVIGGGEVDACVVDRCRVRLHDPNGFIISNSIISDVFVALDEEL